MKVKKIRNVEKTVCCCEQKIAYNYAFSYRDILKRIYDSNNIVIVKDDAYQDVINITISSIKKQGIDKKYNIDAIICAFRNGIQAYLQTDSIITSHEKIGKIFRIWYDIE